MDEVFSLDLEVGEDVWTDVSAYRRESDFDPVRTMGAEPDREIVESRHRGREDEAREMGWWTVDVEFGEFLEAVAEVEWCGIGGTPEHDRHFQMHQVP